jgi:hypothetical protein
MLSLLSPADAALVVYCTTKLKDWQLAFDPMNKQKIYNEEKERNQVWMYQAFIQNAIQSGELPAMQKPKGRAADKKVFERLEIPSELLDAIPQYDYWITLEDLFAFMERAPGISTKDYAHGRDALARLLCSLIDNDALNEKDINEHLAHKIETAEQNLNSNLKLGDNTLKGCCREILDALSAIKNNSEK